MEQLLRAGLYALFCVSLVLPLGTMAQDGEVDPTFTASTNGPVNCIIRQADGRLLVGGGFSMVNGVSRGMLARLNVDGSLDTGFNGGAGFTGLYGQVYALALTPDGQLLVGGEFTQFNGMAANRLVRLNGDGSLDEAFASGSGPNHTVRALDVLPDGRVWVGGAFDQYDGVAASNLVRIDPDGTIDGTFQPSGGFGPQPNDAGTSVHDLQQLAGGGVIAVGDFGTHSGAEHRNIIQFLPNGAVDPAFNSGTGATGGYHLRLDKVLTAPDGKVLIVGDFTNYDGVIRSRLARLNANGSLDTTFDPGGGPMDGPVIAGPIPVTAALLLPDGDLMIGGWFRSYANTTARNLARVLATGALDTTFDPGDGPTNSGNLVQILAMAQLPDGDLIVGGEFSHFDGAPHGNLVRIRMTGGTAIATSERPLPRVIADASMLRVLCEEPPVRARLTDTTGRVVAESARTHQIEIAGLASGTYVLDLAWSDGGHQVVKWAKGW